MFITMINNYWSKKYNQYKIYNFNGDKFLINYAV